MCESTLGRCFVTELTRGFVLNVPAHDGFIVHYSLLPDFLLIEINLDVFVEVRPFGFLFRSPPDFLADFTVCLTICVIDASVRVKHAALGHEVIDGSFEPWFWF